MEEQDKTSPGPRVGAARDFLGSIMRGDKHIWSVYIALFCLSTVEIYSATSQLAYKSQSDSDPAFSHIKFLLIGLIAVLMAQSMSLKSMKAWGKMVWVAAVVLAAITPFFGVEQKGATRSLMGIQPVELCKLGVTMALCAAITAKDSAYHLFTWFRTDTEYRRYWFYLFLIVAATLPITFQNLSSGIIVGLASLGIMFLGRVNGKYLWLTLLVIAVLGCGFWASLKAAHESNAKGLTDIESVEQVQPESLFERKIKRFSTWTKRIFDDSTTPLWEEAVNGEKSQEVCAHMALVNGYPFGRFIGNSKLRDFLPEAFSDYIFAIIFEELGPFGALCVLCLYLYLLLRCILLSRLTQNTYIRLMMVSLPLIMIIQALIHIGVSTGAMFVTGQPLPLLSRGGSSIVGTSISFGLMLALSRLIQQEVAAAAVEPVPAPIEGDAPEADSLAVTGLASADDAPAPGDTPTGNPE